MKSNLFSSILFFFMLFLSVQTFSQTDSDEKTYLRNNVYFKPLDFVFSGLSLGYEHYWNRIGIKAEGGYFYNESPSIYNDDINFEAYRSEVNVKFFTNKNSDSRHFRLYVAAYALYKNATIDQHKNTKYDAVTGNQVDTYKNITASTVGAGVYIGFNVISDGGFTLDAFLGGGLYIPIEDEGAEHLNKDVFNPFERAIAPRTGITLGYAF